MAVKLPPLPYDFDALEPVISAATLKIHYGAHHRGYVEKLNALIRGTDLDALPLEAVVRQAAARAPAGPHFNAAAQAWNHEFFWKSLRPRAPGGKPLGALAERVESDFGGTSQLAEAFKAAANGVFGSGWVWLVVDDGALRIMQTANADTPIAHGLAPLLVVDVWEHAYYLDYQSRRADYVSALVDQLLDWEFAERNFAGQESMHA
jgi:Fe-Mn family superoxide dismutase